MTIWQQENPVPTALPASRLFLEDIEEIVRIFLELYADPKPDPQNADQIPKIQFRIGKEFCDQIQELHKIAQQTKDFGVKLSRGQYEYPYINFGVTENSTQWTSVGFPKDPVWSAFRKLEALFAKRKLRWPSLLWSHRQAAYTVQGAAMIVLISVAPIIAFISQVRLAYRITAVVAVVALNLALWMGLSHHSIVILSNSWDYAARRDDFRKKIIAGVVPALIGAFIGVIGTILVAYFRHTYWP